MSVWHELFVLCVLHHNKLLPGFLLLCYLFSHICVKRQEQRIVHLFLLKGHAILQTIGCHENIIYAFGAGWKAKSVCFFLIYSIFIIIAIPPWKLDIIVIDNR